MLHLVASALLLQASNAPSETSPPATTSPCESEAHRAFDFWVGEWEVSPTGSDKIVARSRIEKLSGGCSIRETWMPLNSIGGTSLSMVNHRTGRWEQTWIGADGRRVDFEGGLVEGKMVLTGVWDDIGGPDKDALVRMTFTPADDGSVRQFGEASSDLGLTWVAFFDYTYKMKGS